VFALGAKHAAFTGWIGCLLDFFRGHTVGGNVTHGLARARNPPGLTVSAAIPPEIGGPGRSRPDMPPRSIGLNADLARIDAPERLVAGGGLKTFAAAGLLR